MEITNTSKQIEDRKICSKCGLPKPINNFSWKNKKKNLIKSQCKSCDKLYRDKQYKGNPEYYIDKNRKNRKKNKTWFQEYKKTLRCEYCGENETCCLDFHHKDSEDKEKILSEMAHSTYSKKRIMEEIKKCYVLCSNCHRKYHNGIITLTNLPYKQKE